MGLEATNEWLVPELIQACQICFIDISSLPELLSRRVRNGLQVSACGILVADKVPRLHAVPLGLCRVNLLTRLSLVGTYYAQN